jgi:hypothetical protein
MLVIVAHPDFPAIRDLFVEGSEVVKKLAHPKRKIASCLTTCCEFASSPVTFASPRVLKDQRLWPRSLGDSIMANSGMPDNCTLVLKE